MQDKSCLSKASSHICFTSDAAIMSEGPAALCQLVQLLVFRRAVVFLQEVCYGRFVPHQRRDDISTKGGGPHCSAV